MNYIIYKTVNLLNGMYYIGCHQTNNLGDGYLGSGKHLKRAIKKYGAKNFKFEILHLVSSKEEMFELERSIVNETLVNSPMTYNLKIGGSGGNPGIVGAFKGRNHSEETKEKQRQASLKQVISDETKRKISNNSWAKRDPTAQKRHVREINLGRPKSDNQKKKLSEIQKGKKLINNGITSTWANQEDLKDLLSQGWMLGRKK